MPEAGDKAPEFTLPRDGSGEISLSDYAGQAVVLYFYPRDDTPGCTTEGKDFTCAAEEFANAGAVVMGVSKDSVASHDKFRDKYDLSVILLSDADGQTCEDYGVWGEKKMYGKTFMGIHRATFLIDGTGRLARVWRNVKVPGHVDEVLEAVRAL
ncbi:MAG: thioredoxin-dependent thiol peroxidase [Pseudooceanicola sp.]